MAIWKRKNRQLVSQKELSEESSIQYQENHEVQLAYERCKYLEIQEQKKIQEIWYQKCQEKKKCCYKFENFLQQVKQGPY